MAYKEYKVLHVTEGGIGTIFLGASGIPIKRLEMTLNKEARRWLDVGVSVRRAEAVYAVLETGSSHYYAGPLTVKAGAQK